MFKKDHHQLYGERRRPNIAVMEGRSDEGLHETCEDKSEEEGQIHSQAQGRVSMML